MLSQRQQGAAFRLFIGGQVFPLGTAHGAEQNGIRLFTGADGLLGKGLAAMVDARAAHESLLAAHGKSKLGAHRVQNLQGLRHNLGPDAVAGQNSNMMVMFTHVADRLSVLPQRSEAPLPCLRCGVLFCVKNVQEQKSTCQTSESPLKTLRALWNANSPVAQR